MAYQSTTIKQLRQQVQTELGLGITLRNADIDSIAAGSVTSAGRLRNLNWGPATFVKEDAGIFRPDAATAADYWRWAGDLNSATGALAHTGANYADTTVGTEVIEIWKKAGSVFRPDIEILNAINYCLQFEMFTTMAAISDLGDNDGDMSASVTTAYTSSNATLTKSTTAARVPWGMRSLRVANSGASGYAQTASVNPTGATTGINEQIKAWAIVSVAAQTTLMDLRDITNSASIASATTTETDPQLVHIPWQNVPTGCTAAAMRIGGASASSDTYANAIWIYNQSRLHMNFPSFVSERFKVQQVFYGRPTGPALTTGVATVYPAQSMEFMPLVEMRDFEWLIGHNNANPYGIQMNREARWYKMWPMFVEVQRPWSDVLTFSGADETQAYNGPTHTLIPRIKQYLLDHVLIPGYPNEPTWKQLRAIAVKELKEAQSIRAPEVVARIQVPFGGVGWI